MGREDKMSFTFAIMLAVLSLSSCFACYQIGREAGRLEKKDK
jgi:hypothetical protein